MKPCAGDSSRAEPSLKLTFCSRQINNNRGVRSDRRELLSPGSTSPGLGLLTRLYNALDFGQWAPEWCSSHFIACRFRTPAVEHVALLRAAPYSSDQAVLKFSSASFSSFYKLVTCKRVHCDKIMTMTWPQVSEYNYIITTCLDLASVASLAVAWQATKLHGPISGRCTDSKSGVVHGCTVHKLEQN